MLLDLKNGFRIFYVCEYNKYQIERKKKNLKEYSFIVEIFRNNKKYFKGTLILSYILQ